MPVAPLVLADHHARLREIADAALVMITKPSKPATVDVLALRSDMTDALRAYQRYVHNDVFAQTAHGQVYIDRHAAAALKVSCIALHAD